MANPTHCHKRSRAENVCSHLKHTNHDNAGASRPVKRMVSSKRPDRRQTSPNTSMINLNIPRKVSQSVPSGKVLHPCADHAPPTDPGIAGASRLRCCLFRRMVSSKRPNRRQPNPNNHTSAAWCRKTSRAVPICTRVQNVPFTQIMVSPERPNCATTTHLRNLPSM